MMNYDRKYVSDEAVEKYDDARFAMLMEGYSARLGEDYVEENRRLQEDGDFDFPAGLDEKCLKAIDAAIAKKRCRENMEKAKRLAKRITVVAASFLVIVALSSVVLFNTVEAFRVVMSDYAIELFDVGEGSLVSVESNEEDGVATPTWVPEGYEITLDKREVAITMLRYSNGEHTISFTAHPDATDGGMTIDTENAIDSYSIEFLDYKGIVVINYQDISLYWFESNAAYCIWSDSIDIDTIVKIAKSCYHNY